MIHGEGGVVCFSRDEPTTAFPDARYTVEHHFSGSELHPVFGTAMAHEFVDYDRRCLETDVVRSSIQALRGTRPVSHLTSAWKAGATEPVIILFYWRGHYLRILAVALEGLVLVMSFEPTLAVLRGA